MWTSQMCVWVAIQISHDHIKLIVFKTGLLFFSSSNPFLGKAIPFLSLPRSQQLRLPSQGLLKQSPRPAFRFELLQTHFRVILQTCKTDHVAQRFKTGEWVSVACIRRKCKPFRSHTRSFMIRPLICLSNLISCFPSLITLLVSVPPIHLSCFHFQD